MLPAAHAGAFAVAALLLIVIPGPSVLFVIGRSLALGRRGGILSVVGNALGMIPAVIAVALGAGTVIAESVVVFTVVKFVGAGYLIWLGIHAIRHRNERPPSDPASPGSRPSSMRLIREGFFVGISNPKTIVFFVAILPQFVDYDAGAIPLQLAILGSIFFAIALVSDGIWALAAGTARSWFTRNPTRLSQLSTAGGVTLIGLGGALALSGSAR